MSTMIVKASFNAHNINWLGDMPMEYNYLFLKAQQNYLNEKLHVQGHLFLNEVFDSLGLRRTPMGATHGWIGEDAYVDFGIFDDPLKIVREATTSIPLEFNITGEIYKDI